MKSKGTDMDKDYTGTIALWKNKNTVNNPKAPVLTGRVTTPDGRSFEVALWPAQKQNDEGTSPTFLGNCQIPFREQTDNDRAAIEATKAIRAVTRKKTSTKDRSKLFGVELPF